MSTLRRPKFDEVSRQLFGWQIDHYARGHAVMEAHAIENCRPTAIALTKDTEDAIIPLTERMNYELAQLIHHAMWKKGDHGDPLKRKAVFAVRIKKAYDMGLVTQQMFTALEACREMRNSFAHADNPDEVSGNSEYKEAEKTLLAIDPEFTKRSVDKMAALLSRMDQQFFPPEDSVCIMVEICEALDLASSLSRSLKGTNYVITPACYGFNDMLAVTTVKETHFADLQRKSRPQFPGRPNTV